MIESGHIVILTGAGISAESGIATFRDSDGLWENHAVEDVASPAGFARDRALVQRFYNARRAQLRQVEPNIAHHSLVKLEREWTRPGHGFTLITQNVDDLHKRAGSQNLLAMHGALNSALCEYCAARTAWLEDLGQDSQCPHCAKRGCLRPDIVWFDEMPYHMDAIWAAMDEARLFVSIGTSGNVYPAAGLVSHARRRGVATLELNLEASQNASAFDAGRYGKAGDIVPLWVDEILAHAARRPNSKDRP